MNTFKRISAKVFGPALLIWGCLLLFFLASHFWSRTPRALTGLDWFTYVGLACFSIWGGIRAVRMGFGDEPIFVPRMTAWKIFLGFLLIAIELKSRFEPAPNILKADNEAEALGMFIVEMVFYVMALWLIVSGIRAKYRKTLIDAPDVS